MFGALPSSMSIHPTPLDETYPRLSDSQQAFMEKDLKTRTFNHAGHISSSGAVGHTFSSSPGYSTALQHSSTSSLQFIIVIHLKTSSIPHSTNNYYNPRDSATTNSRPQTPPPLKVPPSKPKLRSHASWPSPISAHNTLHKCPVNRRTQDRASYSPLVSVSPTVCNHRSPSCRSQLSTTIRPCKIQVGSLLFLS